MDNVKELLNASGAYAVIYQTPDGIRGVAFGSTQDVLCMFRKTLEADNGLGRLLRWACADLVNDRLTELPYERRNE